MAAFKGGERVKLLHDVDGVASSCEGEVVGYDHGKPRVLWDVHDFVLAVGEDNLELVPDTTCWKTTPGVDHHYACASAGCIRVYEGNVVTHYKLDAYNIARLIGELAGEQLRMLGEEDSVRGSVSWPE